MVTGSTGREAHLAALQRRIQQLDLPVIGSSEELARSEAARAARHFGFAQPEFRTSIKLRFTGEGVQGHSLEGDVAANVIGGVTNSVHEAGISRHLKPGTTKLFLSPTVAPGSTVLELYGEPNPSAERLDIDIDDTPLDIAIAELFRILSHVSESGVDDLEMPGPLGKRLYTLAQSLITGHVDLELGWTRPRGATQSIDLTRPYAAALRDYLDRDTVTTVKIDSTGLLTSISTDGQIIVVPSGTKRQVRIEAKDWPAPQLRELWAQEVHVQYDEESTSHPMRDHVLIKRTLTLIEAAAT